MKSKIICFLFGIITLSFFVLPPKKVQALDTDYSIVNNNNSSKSYPSNIPDGWYDTSKMCGAYMDDGKISLVSPNTCMAFVDLIDSNGLKNYAQEPIINLGYEETISFYIEVGFLNWRSGIQVGVSFSYDLPFLDIGVSQNYMDQAYTDMFSEGSFDSQSYYGSVGDYSAIKPVIVDVNRENVTVNNDYRLICVSIKANQQESVNKISMVFGDGLSGGCYSSVDLIINVCENKENINVDSIPFSTGSELTDSYVCDFSSKSISLPISKASMLEFSTSNDVLASMIELDGGNYLSSIANSFLFSGTGDGYIADESRIYFSKAGKYKIKTKKIVDYTYIERVEGEQAPYKTLTISKTEDFVVDFFIYDETCFSFMSNDEEIKNNSYLLFPYYYFIEVKESVYSDLSIRIKVNGEYASENVNDDYFSGLLEKGAYLLSAEVTNKFTGDVINTKNVFVTVAAEDVIYPDIVFENGNTGTAAYDELTDDKVIKATTILKYDMISLNGEVLAEASIKTSGTNPMEGDTISVEVFDGEIYVYGSTPGIITITVTATYTPVIKKTAVFTLNVLMTLSDFTLSKTDVELDLNEKTSENLEFGTISDDVFYKISSGEYYFVYNIPNNFVLMSQDANDAGIITVETNGILGSYVCNVLVYYQEVLVKIINVAVLVSDESTNVTETTFNFVEGTKANMFLNSNEGLLLHIDPLVATMRLQFTWYSLNTKVAVIEKVDQTSARVIAVGSGDTQIVAIYSDTYGSTVTGIIAISVMESIPTIGITITKEQDTSAYTIYDSLHVAINNNNFSFSNTTTYLWYLDNELITLGENSMGNTVAIDNKTTNFYMKFAEGMHEVRVVLDDPTNDFHIEGKQSIKISTIINQERTIGVDCADVIYLALEGERFKISALIDGVVNLDYTYSFSMDDIAVSSIYMNSANEALIEAKKAGETTLNVFTDIGKYETKIIRKEVKIIVEEVKKIEIKDKTEFYKPGENPSFTLLVNGKEGFVNVAFDLEITINGEAIQYSQEGNIVKLSDIPSGRLKLEAGYRNLSDSKSYEVTNFSLKQFVLTILPYLCLSAFLGILIYSIVKINGNPYTIVEKAMGKMNKVVALEKEKVKTINNYKKIKQSYRKIERRTTRLLNKINYYYDEGIDEYKYAIEKVEALNKIIVALIKTVNEETKIEKVEAVINNLEMNQIRSINEIVNEINESHKRYNEVVKKAMSKEEKKIIKQNKKKMTKEEYEQYLIEIGFSNDERTSSEE